MQESQPYKSVESGAGRFSLLRQFPGKWALWWIVFPNIAAIVMMPIGGPSSAFVLFVCGVAALGIASLRNVHLRRIGILVLTLASTLMYGALLFNIDPQKALVSVPYLLELDPVQSPEYVVIGLVLVLSCVFAIWFGARVPAPQTLRQTMLGLGGLALLINVSTMANSDARGTYRVEPAAGMPIDSAVLQNAIAPKAEKGRNVIVIIVESLGVPSNPHDEALFRQIWDAGRWSSRYDVSFGKTAYFGSTTNAEMRELCGLWSDYTRADFDKLDCLPSRFARAGYGTTSIHAFNSTTFDRKDWYPRIGLKTRLFAPQLWAMGAGKCFGVFPGACDRDIPHLIGNMLRAKPEQPQFIYWLTLNSHLPVPANDSLGTSDCQESDKAWNEEYAMLCRGYHLNRELAESLTAEIMRPDFPDADILLVGDHMPPYFQRYIRERFDAAHVPWIMLRSRHGRSENSVLADGRTGGTDPAS